MKNDRKKAGFTLVEVIVVLVILAILAAVLIPTLTGYIDKAKGKAVVAEARGVYLAAQTAVSEQYAVNPEFKKIASAFSGGTRGRVSSYILAKAQNGSYDGWSGPNSVDGVIAENVLAYLDSSCGTAKPAYHFGKAINPLGAEVETYEKTNGQPGVIISYTPAGKVDFVEFGHDGWIARIQNGKVTSTKNGTFSNYPK